MLPEGQAFARDGRRPMLPDDLPDIVRLDEAIPNLLRIDHYRRPMFALIETSGGIAANPCLHARFRNFLLKELLQCTRSVGGTASPGTPRLPLVRTYKHAAQKIPQGSCASNHNFLCAEMNCLIFPLKGKSPPGKASATLFCETAPGAAMICDNKERKYAPRRSPLA